MCRRKEKREGERGRNYLVPNSMFANCDNCVDTKITANGKKITDNHLPTSDLGAISP